MVSSRRHRRGGGRLSEKRKGCRGYRFSSVGILGKGRIDREITARSRRRAPERDERRQAARCPLDKNDIYRGSLSPVPFSGRSQPFSAECSRARGRRDELSRSVSSPTLVLGVPFLSCLILFVPPFFFLIIYVFFIIFITVLPYDVATGRCAFRISPRELARGRHRYKRRSIRREPRAG